MTKTKLSYFATKALLGGSMALLGSQLNAASITINNQEDFEQHFQLDSEKLGCIKGTKRIQQSILILVVMNFSAIAIKTFGLI